MTSKIDHKSRAHALLSASSAHRWLACPPSAVAAELYEDTESDYAAEGTKAHEVAEAVASARWRGKNLTIANTDDPPQGADRDMVEYAKSYADYIMEQITDPDAVVLLEQRVDFSDWVPEGFGTCDCIILQGDTMHIIDYKYGKGVQVDAKDNPQLRLYALGALDDYGIAYDVERVVMHIYQPRLNHVSVDGITVSALLQWGREVVEPAAAKAAKGKGDYSPGEHCKFCPHAGRCVALTRTCTEYVNTHGITAEVPALTPQAVAEALSMEPLVTLWLKRVKAQALSTLLDGGEVPGYKVVEGKQGNRKWTDEVKVAEALKAAGYELGDITETKLLSPAAMDKAIGKAKAAELLTQYIAREPGAPTIAPASDKRQAHDPAADFENLEESIQ